MPRAWDYDVDEMIINLLTVHKELGFNRILLAINDAEIPINQRKLSNHLLRLEEEQIILRGASLSGKVRLCYLHRHFFIQKELRIFEGVRSKGRQKNPVEYRQSKNKKLIRLLFAIAATGVMELVPRSVGKLALQEPEFEAGVSAKDRLGRKSSLSLIKNKFVDDFSAEEIDEYLKILSDSGIIRPVSGHGEIRFEFCDQKVHDFIFHWNILLDTIITNMQDKWILLNKRVITKEKIWYNSIFARQESNNFFTNIVWKRLQHYEALKEFCKKNYDPKLESVVIKATRKVYEKRVKETDLRVKRQIKELEVKYSDIKGSQPVIYDLIREMIYSPFKAS